MDFGFRHDVIKYHESRETQLQRRSKGQLIPREKSPYPTHPAAKQTLYIGIATNKHFTFKALEGSSLHK
jgi:hypothetical protein